MTRFEQIAILVVIFTAIISLIYAWYLRNRVMKKDKGTAEMQAVWNAIRIGADSYLNRQMKTILPAVAVLTMVLFLSVYVVPPSLEALEEFPENTQVHHRDRPHGCIYHGRGVLAAGRSARHAHGHPGQCAGCFGFPARFQ